MLHRRLAAGDSAALEVGGALHGDLEAAVPGLQPALLGHAGVVAVCVLLDHRDAGAGAAVADGREAYAYPTANT